MTNITDEGKLDILIASLKKTLYIAEELKQGYQKEQDTVKLEGYHQYRVKGSRLNGAFKAQTRVLSFDLIEVRK